MRRYSNKKLALGALLLAVVILAILALLPGREQGSELPSLADSVAPRQTAPAGSPLSMGSVFGSVTENDRLALAVNSQGQLRVSERGSGYAWYSNPQQEAMALEQVQGYWRRALESPFIVEYLDLTGIATEVISASAADLDTKVTFHELDGGVEIAYDLQKIDLQFSYLLRLTDEYLEVTIPDDRIRESGNARLVRLWALPMFGALQGASHTGYMFVPDGIGALIPFDPTTSYSIQYASGPIYEEDVLYPVFGMASGEHGFVGIIDEGEYTARVVATPGGMYTTFNWVTSPFVYRQDYFKLTSLFGEGFQMFQEARTREDRRLRYYLLSGDEADYAGMAGVYRRYLMEAKGLDRQTQPAYPLDLYVMGGDREKALLGRRQVPVTTFAQASEMVRALSEAGTGPIDVTYKGWEHKGYLQATPERLPPSAQLGGADGLAALAEAVHARDGKLYLGDNFATAYSTGSGFEPKRDAIRDYNGKVVSEGLELGVTEYTPKPYLSWRYMRDSLDEYRELGADGIYHEGLGERLQADETLEAPLSRRETAAVYGAMLAETAERLGAARVEHGHAYTLPYADHIGSLPFDTSYDRLASVKVPFYPIALHGLVSYAGIPINVQEEAQTAFLQTLEYGALPSYLLTYDDPARLKHTLSDGIYSSEFRIWQERVQQQYAELKAALEPLASQFIVDHRQLAPGVYETIYEDGTRIVVNYTGRLHTAGTLAVGPGDYAVAKGDGA
ncbi:hypothetical protein PA598K_04130 [Paenibacillus sp. 598K]|uniref:DUF5696 domain-containing protein n=1 Tax=Paenibacillus sp. 598K TaxID=1117987 RepID=UPI000FF94ACB|nr:DUF5696 domain-containing protein [Paenibacillus sp. 598K]GBF75704.1 hypothetical protein PA598K_04130 [Paenibacillus sp. 598K]